MKTEIISSPESLLCSHQLRSFKIIYCIFFFSRFPCGSSGFHKQDGRSSTGRRCREAYNAPYCDNEIIQKKYFSSLCQTRKPCRIKLYRAFLNYLNSLLKNLVVYFFVYFALTQPNQIVNLLKWTVNSNGSFHDPSGYGEKETVSCSETGMEYVYPSENVTLVTVISTVVALEKPLTLCLESLLF